MKRLSLVQKIILAITAGVFPFLIIGCGTSQPPRFYTLQSVTSRAAAVDSVSKKESVISLGVGPVEIPDYVDQAQIITRAGRNQLNVAEFDLWGGSLKDGVARVLLENLSVFLTPHAVTVVSWRSYVPTTYRVPVNIIRLDAVKGGDVTVQARWVVVAKDKTLGMIRETSVKKPVKGNEYSDVVAAMGDALEDLSRDISAEVRRTVAR